MRAAWSAPCNLSAHSGRGAFACSCSTQALTFCETACLFMPYTEPSTSTRAAAVFSASVMAFSASVSSTRGMAVSGPASGSGYTERISSMACSCASIMASALVAASRMCAMASSGMS